MYPPFAVKWADVASASQHMGNRGRKQLKVTAKMTEASSEARKLIQDMKPLPINWEHRFR